MNTNGELRATAPDPAMSPTPVTVTIKGVNFVRRSSVVFKGKPVPTQVLGPGELRFTLDEEAMRAAGRFDLNVVNPAPVDTFFTRGMWGTGASNLAHLIVNYRY